MGDVIQANFITQADLPPDRVLEAALDKLEGVIVIGYTKDGEEYFASSYGDAPEMLWLIERFKQRLFE